MKLLHPAKYFTISLFRFLFLSKKFHKLLHETFSTLSHGHRHHMIVTVQFQKLNYQILLLIF